MNKNLLLGVAALALAANANAETIWSGSEKLDWDWDNHHIEAKHFAGTERGDYLTFYVEDCTGGWFDLESLESIGAHFFERWMGSGTTSYLMPLTGNMHKNFLQGINVYGSGLTLTKIDRGSYERKDLVTENTLWFNCNGDVFNDPSWSLNIDLPKDWFETIDGEEGWKLRLHVEAIPIEEGQELRVCMAHLDWSGDFGYWDEIPANGCIDLELDWDTLDAIYYAGGVKVRGFGYKLNTVEITTEAPTSIISTLMTSEEANTPIYNLQGISMGTDKAQIPAGLYIQNGKKFIVQ